MGFYWEKSREGLVTGCFGYGGVGPGVEQWPLSETLELSTVLQPTPPFSREGDFKLFRWKMKSCPVCTAIWYVSEVGDNVKEGSGYWKTPASPLGTEEWGVCYRKGRPEEVPGAENLWDIP